jgi:hypothetical protein
MGSKSSSEFFVQLWVLTLIYFTSHSSYTRSTTRSNRDADHQHARPDLRHHKNDCLGAIDCNAWNELRIAIAVGHRSSSAGWHL